MFRIFAFSFTRLNLPQLCTDKVTSISYFEADQELKKKKKNCSEAQYIHFFVQFIEFSPVQYPCHRNPGKERDHP